MTPAERARLINQQEFDAECRAIRQKALRYAQARRQEEIARWAKILATDTPKPKPKAGVVPMGRKPKLYTYNGEAKSLSEWATKYDLDYGTLANRIRNGIPIERALTMKPGERARLHFVNGVSKTLEEWAEHAGIHYNTLIARMKTRTLAEALAMQKGKGRSRRKVQPQTETASDLPSTGDGPGVVADFAGSTGTGAGRTAQEIPNLTFPDEANNQ